MIKNINDLKKCQIVCRNQEQVKDCLNMLEELGFEVRNNDNQYKVIFYREYSGMFENDMRLECNKDTYFFDKKFIKILKKLINEEKEEQEKEEKEKVEDIEVASDERITKVNIYKKTFNFLKKIYPDVKQYYEVRLEYSVVGFDNYGHLMLEYHPVPNYKTMANIPFDIRSREGRDIYIDGHIFYDFKKVKRYINKVIKGNKND